MVIKLKQMIEWAKETGKDMVVGSGYVAVALPPAIIRNTKKSPRRYSNMYLVYTPGRKERESATVNFYQIVPMQGAEQEAEAYLHPHATLIWWRDIELASDGHHATAIMCVDWSTRNRLKRLIDGEKYDMAYYLATSLVHSYVPSGSYRNLVKMRCNRCREVVLSKRERFALCPHCQEYHCLKEDCEQARMECADKYQYKY